MTDTSINDFNLKIRQTPWYQEWFALRGLNPNQVKLNKQQREELKALVEKQSGFRLPGDMKIDPAGNLNEKGGWAGLPTGVKIAIIAGATLATAGAAGAFSGGASAASAASGGSGLTTGLGVAPSLAGSTAAGAGSMAGGIAGGAATGTAAAGTGGIVSNVARALSSPVANVISRGIAGASQAAASNRGTELEARQAYDALNLQAERERRSAETDAYRKSLYGQLALGYQPSQRPAGANGRYPEGFVTQGARDAGQLMYDTAMKRMREQDYPTITPFEDYPTRPGTLERVGSYLAPALSLFDPRLYGR